MGVSLQRVSALEFATLPGQETIMEVARVWQKKVAKRRIEASSIVCISIWFGLGETEIFTRTHAAPNPINTVVLASTSMVIATKLGF